MQASLREPKSCKGPGPSATKRFAELLCILILQESKLKIILLCNLGYARNVCMICIFFYSHYQNKNFIGQKNLENLLMCVKNSLLQSNFTPQFIL